MFLSPVTHAADATPAATGTSAEQPAPATPSPAQPANVKEAAARFERGLALYDDGDYEAALVEFSRAYELQPTYKILYNIAKIERVKNDYSTALNHYEHYLEQGGAEIPAERREEVEKEIAVLKERVALVTINANVEGAVVYIDGIPLCSARTLDPTCVGTTPLRGPVIVNPGKRKITAVKQGYQNADVQLTLAGGDKNSVKLDLFDLRPKSVDTAPRDRAIISWGVTGALAVGAGVMGVLTLSKKSDYDHDRDLPPCANQTVNSNSCLTDTARTLSDDKDTTKTFALVTDVLAGAAVVGAVVSTYFTIKASKAGDAEQHAERFRIRNLRVGAGPGSAVLMGSF
ncbi:MAG TPA: tetratricopeptide repeat protein [Polyangiaceae bacterium]|nr:tetratricopeptide repeat protein [Polyangiaceae bacterium]